MAGGGLVVVVGGRVEVVVDEVELLVVVVLGAGDVPAVVHAANAMARMGTHECRGKIELLIGG